jgi:hypothetical protein
VAQELPAVRFFKEFPDSIWFSTGTYSSEFNLETTEPEPIYHFQNIFESGFKWGSTSKNDKLPRL